MKVTLETPNGNIYRVDLPDGEFLGMWLKILFDEWASDMQGYPYQESEFKLRIAP